MAATCMYRGILAVLRSRAREPLIVRWLRPLRVFSGRIAKGRQVPRATL